MRFYTHVAQWGNQLLVRAVENGVRSNFKVKYEPTLYVPVAKDTGWKTLDGKNVTPMQFLSIKEAKEFVEQYESQPHLVYGLTQFPYTYIADKYPKQIQFDSSQMRIVTIDIEVECENGFPNADKRWTYDSLSQSKTMTLDASRFGDCTTTTMTGKMFNTSSVRQNVNF